MIEYGITARVREEAGRQVEEREKRVVSLGAHFGESERQNARTVVESLILVSFLPRPSVARRRSGHSRSCSSCGVESRARLEDDAAAAAASVIWTSSGDDVEASVSYVTASRISRSWSSARFWTRVQFVGRRGGEVNRLLVSSA